MPYRSSRARRCSITIQGEIPAAVDAWLIFAAYRDGTSRSALVRELLDASKRHIESGGSFAELPEDTSAHVHYTVCQAHLDWLREVQHLAGASMSAALRLALETGLEASEPGLLVEDPARLAS